MVHSDSDTLQYPEDKNGKNLENKGSIIQSTADLGNKISLAEVCMDK